MTAVVPAPSEQAHLRLVSDDESAASPEAASRATIKLSPMPGCHIFTGTEMAECMVHRTPVRFYDGNHEYRVMLTELGLTDSPNCFRFVGTVVRAPAHIDTAFGHAAGSYDAQTPLTRHQQGGTLILSTRALSLTDVE